LTCAIASRTAFLNQKNAGPCNICMRSPEQLHYEGKRSWTKWRPKPSKVFKPVRPVPTVRTYMSLNTIVKIMICSTAVLTFACSPVCGSIRISDSSGAKSAIDLDQEDTIRHTRPRALQGPAPCGKANPLKSGTLVWTNAASIFRCASLHEKQILPSSNELQLQSATVSCL
jgi:hypothetical protein